MFGIEAGLIGLFFPLSLLVPRFGGSVLHGLGGLEVQLIERHADILFADAEEAANADHHGNHVALFVDDHVVDLAEIVAVAVLDGAADQGFSRPIAREPGW